MPKTGILGKKNSHAGGMAIFDKKFSFLLELLYVDVIFEAARYTVFVSIQLH